MASLLLLLGLLILITVLAYFLCEKDPLAPGVVMPATFAISTFSCLCNWPYWRTSLCATTFGVIISGVLTFIVTALLIQYYFRSKYGTKYLNEPFELHEIKVNGWKIGAVIALNLCCIMLEFLFVVSVVATYSPGSMVSWNQLMIAYRTIESYDALGVGVIAPVWLRQSVQLCYAFDIIFAYVIVNNSLAKDGFSLKREWQNFLPIIFSVGVIVLEGGRLFLLHLFLISLMFFHYLVHKKIGWQSKVYSLRLVKNVIVLCVVLLAFFFGLRSFVGRPAEEPLCSANEKLFYWQTRPKSEKQLLFGKQKRITIVDSAPFVLKFYQKCVACTKVKVSHWNEQSLTITSVIQKLKDASFYLNLYAGGSIHLLDDFIRHPIPPSDIWGKETFRQVIGSVARYFHNKKLDYMAHKEFRSSNGWIVGNVYTAFRSFLYDFGFAGVIWCTALVSLLLNFSYYLAKYRKKSNDEIEFLLVFFVQFLIETFFMSIEVSATRLLSHAWITTFVRTYVAYWFIQKFTISRLFKGNRLSN